MTAPAITAPPTSPALLWHGAEIEPTDEFLDALVAMLANVADRRAAAGGEIPDADRWAIREYLKELGGRRRKRRRGRSKTSEPAPEHGG